MAHRFFSEEGPSSSEDASLVPAEPMRQQEPKELRALARRGAVTVAVLGALGPPSAAWRQHGLQLSARLDFPSNVQPRQHVASRASPANNCCMEPPGGARTVRLSWLPMDEAPQQVGSSA